MATDNMKGVEQYEETLEFVPVFMTAEIPQEVLQDFITAATNGRAEAEIFRPVIMTTTEISSIKAPSTTAPPAQATNPFLGWTVDEVYHFFQTSISSPNNEVFGPWTAHTFVVLDQRTANDKSTCFLCSDVPDYLERDRVILKSVRSVFDQSLLEGMCYETFVRRPSESGAGALGAGATMTGKEDFLGLVSRTCLYIARKAFRD